MKCHLQSVHIFGILILNLELARSQKRLCELLIVIDEPLFKELDSDLNKISTSVYKYAKGLNNIFKK